MTTLSDAGHAYETDRQQFEHSRETLQALIREARAGGMSLRQIAKESGLSHQRVHQLTTERAER